MVKIEMRRMFLMYFELRSGWFLMNLSRKPYGIIKLLLTIVDKANVDTITMDITAENPPKKTSVAKKELPFSRGNSKE